MLFLHSWLNDQSELQFQCIYLITLNVSAPGQTVTSIGGSVHFTDVWYGSGICVERNLLLQFQVPFETRQECACWDYNAYSTRTGIVVLAAQSST